jgi:xylulokinase
VASTFGLLLVSLYPSRNGHNELANGGCFSLDSPSVHLMTKDLLLAIDVGTGSARAALVTQSGKIAAFAANEYQQNIPRFGWSQQSPRIWWEGVVFSIRRVITEVPGAIDRIAGIAACGQMHATVLIDEDGELVLEEVPLWNDKRTRALVGRMLQEHDPEALFSLTANPPTVAWPAFKLAWIKQNAPKAYAAARTFLTPKDYINFKLTGEQRIDFCEASCSYMFDLESWDWSQKLLRVLQLDLDKLPPLAGARERLGSVTNEAAQLTGLRAGTPVAVGAGDFAAALLGAGVTNPGVGCDITGTSTLTALLSTAPIRDPVISNLYCVTGGWAAFTIIDASGDAMRWARTLLNDRERGYEEIISLAESVPAGSEQLLFLPYLNAERLARKANSRAQFFGLTSSHGPAHLYRAVMEGVGFASKRNIDLMERRGHRFDRLVAAGGGAKGRLWLEIKASMYDRPILVPSEPECGVVGCGMLAGCASGLFSSLEATISEQVRYNGEIYPNPEWTERYRKMQLLFDDLYQSSEQFWDRFES